MDNFSFVVKNESDLDEIAELLGSGVSVPVAREIVNLLVKHEILQFNKSFSIFEFMDIFHGAIDCMRKEGITAEEYFISIKEIQREVDTVNPLSALGNVFSNPIFTENMIWEIADMERKETGPKKGNGFYNCPRCKADKTFVTSDIVQKRRADEPQTIINVCEKCGLRFDRN